MFRLRTKRVKVGDHIYKVYSIGWLAKMLGVTVVHLRRMERTNILPKPILAADISQRYYLVDELINYSKLYKEKKPNANRGYRKSGFLDAVWAVNNSIRRALVKAPDTLHKKLPNEKDIEKYYKEIREGEENNDEKAARKVAGI